MLGRRGEMAFGRKRRRELINDDQVLSQYGSNKRPVGGPAFRSRPRDGIDRGGISLIRGSVAASDAHGIVGLQAPRAGDGVRRTSAGILRVAGFTVEHDPTQANPDHVRVMLPRGEWTDQHAKQFDGCFTEGPEWHGEEEST